MFETKIYDIKGKNEFIPFIQEIFKKKYDFNESLCSLHKVIDKIPLENQKSYTHIGILGKDDRVCPFIKEFHLAVDATNEFERIYHEFIRENILPLVDSDMDTIVIQKTPNIRFSFPHYAAIGHNPNIDQDQIVGYHKDADFGHHPTEQNIIVPITDMFGTNSVYYETDIESKEFRNLTMGRHQFFHGYLNQLHHYNMFNQTDCTRISFDLRVIPYDKYLENWNDFKGTKFELGKYYIVLGRK